MVGRIGKYGGRTAIDQAGRAGGTCTEKGYVEAVEVRAESVGGNLRCRLGLRRASSSSWRWPVPLVAWGSTASGTLAPVGSFGMVPLPGDRMSTHHVTFVVLAIAVAAPLLAEVRLGFRVPIVVIEVLLGVLAGPHVLGFVQYEGLLVPMFRYAMACTLFMAGLELDFGEIRGRPLSLALGGWTTSLLVALAAAWVLHVTPSVSSSLVVALTLATTGLGVLLPVFRDSGVLGTQFGRLVLAAGTVGEVGPIVLMSMLLPGPYGTWQELGFLAVFLFIVAAAIVIGVSTKEPRILRLFSRTMHASSQLPVRISILILVGLFLLAEKFGFESIFGAFAAGMVVGLASLGKGGELLREKIDAVMFGWFYPFFFVSTGIRLDLPALIHDGMTVILVLVFMVLFLVVRGAPTFLYGKTLARAERLPFGLSTAVPSLSIIVVITDVGASTGTMKPDVASALVGAALLATMLFPTIAGVLISRNATARPETL